MNIHMNIAVLAYSSRTYEASHKNGWNNWNLNCDKKKKIFLNKWLCVWEADPKIREHFTLQIMFVREWPDDTKKYYKKEREDLKKRF